MAIGERKSYKGGAAPTRLASSLSDSATSFTVATGTASGYPDGTDGPFVVGIDVGTSTEEKILCSSRSGDTFTVAAGGRGFDDTQAISHSVVDDAVTHVLDAESLTDHADHIYDTDRDDHEQYLRTDGTRALSGDLSAGSNKITDLATPTADGDAAPKGYVDPDYEEFQVTAGAVTIDYSTGGTYRAEAETDDLTVTFDAPTVATADRFTLFLVITVSIGVTWPSSVTWDSGAAPTFSAAGAHLIEFVSDGTGYWAARRVGIFPVVA